MNTYDLELIIGYHEIIKGNIDEILGSKKYSYCEYVHNLFGYCALINGTRVPDKELLTSLDIEVLKKSLITRMESVEKNCIGYSKSQYNHLAEYLWNLKRLCALISG